MKRLGVIVLLTGCACGAWLLQRGEGTAPRPAGVNAPSPVAELMVAGLGGFRGVVSEFIWFRADRLQDEGRFAELAQMASWLTFLEPYSPDVWAYAAWNLAYNISVMMPTPEDRWRWVEAGLKLLRDDGLRLNPSEPVLYRELAWLFLLKMGGGLDSAAGTYQAAWAQQVRAADASGDWRALKLDPAVMKEVEAEYGAQTWTHPYAHALYWARAGLEIARDPVVRRELRQIVYQTLIMETRQDPRFAAAALREMKAAYQEAPVMGLKDVMEKFRARYALPAE